MKINIKATNLELRSEMKSFVEEKVGSLAKFISHPDGGIQSWVELEMSKHPKKGNVFRAEIQIAVPHVKEMVRTESSSSDLRTAIDDARDLMKLELQKNKDRKISLSRQGARAVKEFIRSLSFWKSQ